MQGSRWPFLQRISGPRPAVSVWMPSVIIPKPNPNLLRPCLLKSSGTVPWITNSFDYLLHKEEVIKWVNARLGDPNKSISNVTIGVIMNMLTWEVSPLDLT